MRIVKVLSQTIARLAKQAWLLPHSLAIAFKERGRQTARDELEAERLDRIRNPSKYLGK
jgi:hypothetical protein